jgi:NAD(P)H-flavin reductase
MHDLHALPVVSVTAIAARQALLVVDAHDSVVHRGHTAAGQYVKLGLSSDDVARPIALANRPGPAMLEFLIKAPDERLAEILALAPADKVNMSAPLGPGFPVARARGRDLWMFAVGSGVAPLKAVVEQVLAERSAFGDVVLYYGVRTADELCFTERFGAWLGQGVRVVPVVSRAGDGKRAWSGARGHVQDHLPAAFARPDDTVAFVCGLPEMERSVAAALLERGVGPDRVLRNW